MNHQSINSSSCLVKLVNVDFKYESEKQVQNRGGGCTHNLFHGSGI